MSLYLVVVLFREVSASSFRSESWLNAQLYPCKASSPWRERQEFLLEKSGAPSVISSRGGKLELQLGNGGSPSNSTTCPPHQASCWNVVLDTAPAPASQALKFMFNSSAGQLRAYLPTLSATTGDFCLAADWDHSHGFLPNVILTDCNIVTDQRWDVRSGTVKSTARSCDHYAPNTQCLDAGSGGSGGDFGFRLDLLPAPLPEMQAFRSASLASWGGSPIADETTKDGLADVTYHLFNAVFSGNAGLKGWQSHSEVLHSVAHSPAGPYHPTHDGPHKDGIVLPVQAHNPQIVRATDGTYLLFNIGGHTMHVSSSLDGPWNITSFPRCNNPAPLVVPHTHRMYVYCHCGPDRCHWGASLGVLTAPSWRGPWTPVRNNTEDLYDGGASLFAHPMEDPFVWAGTDGRFHMLFHAFRMAEVSATLKSGCQFYVPPLPSLPLLPFLPLA